MSAAVIALVSIVLVALGLVVRRVRRAWVAASARVDAALAQLPPVPAHDASWDRLRQAVRDEQQKGEQP
ncbi:hypothetical protein GCM10018980_51270 [Streptomyces capoamus]|uniref:Uncharacterized protein n=1 Tax=Streptomyces capoamus TaxID=68183 RepID=A0A919KD88_9ACTN|nr:hypothetical protein [Streptomyces capoamus]GGW15844.1 hypothetical protein GCM10010501_29540 [Streptomyces libani subsp. rufus]GHG61815.1 hypothetical protein GCM10018980_51270 [Streptomyces capoamus]